MNDAGHPLQQLYEAEINFALNTVWDGGFIWRLGDEANGFLDEGRAGTFDGAVRDLVAAAVRHHPGITTKSNTRAVAAV